MNIFLFQNCKYAMCMAVKLDCALLQIFYPKNRLWVSWNIHFEDFVDILQHWWSLWNTFSRVVFSCWQSNPWHCNTKRWMIWWLSGLPGCHTIKKVQSSSSHMGQLRPFYTYFARLKMFASTKVNLSLAVSFHYMCFYVILFDSSMQDGSLATSSSLLLKNELTVLRINALKVFIVFLVYGELNVCN